MTAGPSLATRAGQALRRAMTGIAWFSVFHPRTVLILAGVVTGIAIWCASGLRLSTDVEDLLPRNVPAAQRVKSLLHTFGGSEPVVIGVSGRGDEDLEDRIDLALALRDRLATNPHLRPVRGLFGEDPWALLDGPQAEAMLLYLTPHEIGALGPELTTEAIDRRVAKNRESLRSPLGALGSRLVAEDPLGFAGLALAHLGSLKGQLKLVAREGVLATEDGTYVLLLVRPALKTTEIDNAKLVLGEIEQAARDALAAQGLAGTAGIGPPPPGAPAGQIHVGLTGAPAILIDFRGLLAGDVAVVSLISYIAQLVLFLFAFRRVGGLLIAGTSLAVGTLWALGFAALAIGEINVFTAGSLGILCGLTVDFTVHIYNRYLEEIHLGRDMARAFDAAHGETGLGILASVGVMVWSFFAAGLSSFRGLRDLGMICAAGLALSLVACLFLVPALTALWVRLVPRADAPRGLAGFGLEALLTRVVRRPRTTVVLALLGFAALSLPAVKAHLDEDFSRFRPQNAPSIRLQNEIAARTGTSLQAVLALVPGADDAEILDRSAKIVAAFDRLVPRAEVGLAAVLGPARLVPAPADQREALAALGQLRGAGGVDPARVERDLLAALPRHGFRVDERARRAAARVRTLLERAAPLTVEQARQGPLGAIVDDLLIRDAAGQRLGVVSAYPRPDARSTRLVPALRQAVEASGAPAELVGVRVLSQQVRPVILHDGIVATLLAAVGVMTILWFAFRSFTLVALTMIPLVTGLAASVGVMAAANIDFNLVTVSMLPLILGIAIDNGIHVVHRYREGLRDGATDMVEVFRHTGRGVVMATLTTVVGFGALLFADYPGLVSSGILAMVGTTATLVAAMTLLPALLVLLPRRR